jgi:predicted ATPase
MNYEVFTSALEISLAQGLAALGLFDEGVALLNGATERGEVNGDLCYMAEALRIRGGLLLSKSDANADDAEHCFQRSLALSRRQGARAWELRSATDLAALWAGQGRNRDAHALLQPVYARFSEGLDTPDLKSAARLVAALQ